MREEPHSVPGEGETLSIEEATRRFRVSRATLQRRLAAGEVAGALKAPGPKGPEWRLPATSLAALGYRPLEEPVRVEASPPTLLPDLSELVSSLAALIDALRAEREAERCLLQAALEDRRRAEAERDAARAEVERLKAELAPGR